MQKLFQPPLERIRKIPLSQGKFAIVDDEDFEWLSQWKWIYQPHHSGNGGYAFKSKYLGGGRKDAKYQRIMMHRLILNTPEGKETDHKNGNKLDNRRSNLRIATPTENKRNRNIQINNTSGYKGVSWHKRQKKWIAKISVNRKRIWLGTFNTGEKAALIYNEAAIKYYKEFAKINIL